MLRKIMFEDIKSTWKQFSLIIGITCLAVIAIPPIIPLGNSGTSEEIASLLLAFCSLLFGIGIIAIAVSIVQFISTRLFSSEAYLHLSVPASSKTIVFSKLACCIVWMIIAMVLIWFSILIGVGLFLAIEFSYSLTEVIKSLESVFTNLNSNLSTAEEVLSDVNSLLQILSSITLITACFAFAATRNLSRKHLNTVGILLFLIIVYLFNGVLNSIITNVISSQLIIEIINLVILVLGTVGAFFLTCYFIDNKLELN